MTADVGGLWERVVGQDAAVAILRGAVSRGEVAHAWLFVGPPGVGQPEAAAALAADLNCPERPAGTVACGVCSTCQRIVDGVHPAARTFEPEGAEHVVGSVREEWIPAATRSLVEGRVRVLRVAAAERMNEGAQNAFLKVLEEPPGAVVWVLDAEDHSELLDTIVSRCRRLDFAPWTPDDLRRWAAQRGIAAERRDALVRAAMGNPERLGLLGREGMVEARDRHLRIVTRLVDDGPGVAVPLAKELDRWARDQRDARAEEAAAELARLDEAFGGEWPPGVRGRVTKRHERQRREERRRLLQLALDDLASCLRDVVAARAGGPLLNIDHASEIRRLAERLPPDAALVGLDAVHTTAEALDRQGQPELHLERLLLRLGVAIYRAGS